MSTFTAQELADFYQQVADGGEIKLHLIRPPNNKPEWEANCQGPNLASDPDMWLVKPKKKVVDLSVLIASHLGWSRVDCEFSHDGECWPFLGSLSGIKSESLDGVTQYRSRYQFYPKCRPRMNHLHAWQGGECPLPEGLLVKVWYRRMGFAHISSSDYIDDWRHDGDYDTNIIAFEVLGLAEGWQWPFED